MWGRAGECIKIPSFCPPSHPGPLGLASPYSLWYGGQGEGLADWNYTYDHSTWLNAWGRNWAVPFGAILSLCSGFISVVGLVWHSKTCVFSDHLFVPHLLHPLGIPLCTSCCLFKPKHFCKDHYLDVTNMRTKSGMFWPMKYWEDATEDNWDVEL